MESLNNQCSSSNKDNNYSQLCNYQLLNKIGEGQFGVVLLSRFRPTGELLAAKVMDKNKMQRIGEKQIEHIQNERKILESLPNHVYINKLFAFIETEDKYYLINEYISGGDLALKLSQLPGYRLATHVAKLCVAEVLTAIEFLHQNNIIYRDLKPGNILIDKSGHIKLTGIHFHSILTPLKPYSSHQTLDAQSGYKTTNEQRRCVERSTTFLQK
jgi:protein kinase A